MQAASPSTSYEDLAALYGRMGQALDTDHPGEDFTPLGDLIDDYIRNLDQQPNYIATGIGPLDRNLHILPGNFILIGGRPSAGKTALSLQIAVEMAKQGRKVCYFSLETSPQILAQRIIANQLYAPLEQVKTKKVPAAELDGLSKLRKLAAVHPVGVGAERGLDPGPGPADEGPGGDGGLRPDHPARPVGGSVSGHHPDLYCPP